jgi:hypothetical protein
LEDSVIAGVVG